MTNELHSPLMKLLINPESPLLEAATGVVWLPSSLPPTPSGSTPSMVYVSIAISMYISVLACKFVSEFFCLVDEKT